MIHRLNIFIAHRKKARLKSSAKVRIAPLAVFVYKGCPNEPAGLNQRDRLSQRSRDQKSKIKVFLLRLWRRLRPRHLSCFLLAYLAALAVPWFPLRLPDLCLRRTWYSSYMFLCLSFPTWWRSCKESACQCKRLKRGGFDPRVRKIPWRSKWQPSSLLAYRAIWTEEPCRLQSMGW